jgi:hypothetical protein
MEAYFEPPYSAYGKCDREDVFTILPANCTLPISASDTQLPSIARFGIFLLSQVHCFVSSQLYLAEIL